MTTSLLWKDEPLLGKAFALNTNILSRDRVVKTVKQEIASQLAAHPDSATSVQLSGCQGSGKTSLLHLLASSFKADGYEVYFIKDARDIPRGASAAFTSLLQEQTQKVAVLIDGVDLKPKSPLFATLLKGPFPRLVTVGSSVPRTPPGVSARFKSKLHMSDLNIAVSDEDFQELIQHYIAMNVATPEMTEGICKYWRDQFSGHTYPTLTYIEYFFTHVDAKSILTNWQTFRKHFMNHQFSESSVYQSVKNRCYAGMDDPPTAEAVHRVLCGRPEPHDLETSTQFGWWDPKSRDVITAFLKNLVLQSAQAAARTGW